MAISKHIFPLVLDGALQAVSASGSSTAWNGLTSYVEVDSSGGNETITLANGTISGTLVTVIKKGATNTITVNPATDFAADQPSVALAEDNEMCTFFWNNSSWRVFNQAEMGGFAGGSVSSLTVTGATALNGGLAMDTDKFTVADTSGNTAIAGTLGVTGAATFTAGSQNSAVARTATADGSGTGTIAAGTSFVSVTSANAAHIVVLPTPVVGNSIVLHVGATGYELRTNDPSSVSLNNVSGSAKELAIAANVVIRCTCVSSTAWIAEQISNVGAPTGGGTPD